MEGSTSQPPSPISLNRIYYNFANQFQTIYTTINQGIRERIPVQIIAKEQIPIVDSSLSTRGASLSNPSALNALPLSRQDDSCSSFNDVEMITGQGDSQQQSTSLDIKATTARKSSLSPSFWSLSSISTLLSFGRGKQSSRRGGGGVKKSTSTTSSAPLIRPRPARVIAEPGHHEESLDEYNRAMDAFKSSLPKTPSVSAHHPSFVLQDAPTQFTPLISQLPSTTAKERLQSAKIRQLEKKINWLITQQLSTIKHDENEGADSACDRGLVGGSGDVVMSTHSPIIADTEEHSVFTASSLSFPTASIAQSASSIANIPPPPPPPPADFIARLPTTAQDSGTTPRIPALKKTAAVAAASSTPPLVMKSLLSEMKQVVLKPVVVGLLEDEFAGEKKPRKNKAKRAGASHDPPRDDEGHFKRALREKFMNAGEEDTEVESEWELNDSCV